MASLEGDEVMGGTLTGEISLLTKETPESSHPLPPHEDMLKITAVHDPGSGPLPGTRFAGNLTCLVNCGEKKILWFKSHPVYGMFVIAARMN